MGNFIDRLLRVDERALKKIEKKADLVLSYEEEMKGLTDEELQAKTPYFKELLANGKTLDDILLSASLHTANASGRISSKVFPLANNSLK